MPPEIQDDTSSRSSGAGGECERTAERLARYIHGGASRAEHTEFRSHRRACPSCDERFHEALARTGELARKRREERRQKERTERLARRRMHAIEGADSRVGRGRGAGSRRRRNAHMRLFLMPAFAVFLMLGIYPATRSWGPPRAALTVTSGAVLVSGETVAAGAEARTVKRGDWCSLNVGGAGEIVLGDTRVGLESGSLLLIENSYDLRVRLDGGRITIEGPCTITAEAGVVEVLEGSGHVAKLPGGLEVHVREGTWVASNSLGNQRLIAGETTLLRLR